MYWPWRLLAGVNGRGVIGQWGLLAGESYWPWGYCPGAYWPDTSSLHLWWSLGSVGCVRCLQLGLFISVEEEQRGVYGVNLTSSHW